MIALRGQAAVDRAGPDGDQDLAVVAELAQHVHVLGVADPALDQADVARPAMLDVGERRAIELDALEQREQRSSMSSSDMWQPKQPASDVVAIFSLRRVTSVMASPGRRGASAADFADRRLVEPALADRHVEADALAQDRADRTDVIALSAAHAAVAQQAGQGEFTIRCLAMPRPPSAKTFLPSTSR